MAAFQICLDRRLKGHGDLRCAAKRQTNHSDAKARCGPVRGRGRRMALENICSSKDSTMMAAMTNKANIN